jgi:hypothetical protein
VEDSAASNLEGISMDTDTTIEVTQYRNLNDGDIFQANTQHGGAVIAMKVASRQTRDDEASHDVLVFYPDKPPALFNEGYIANKGVVGKLKNLSFSVSHRQPADLILDKSDIRARAGAGCVYIHGDDYYLGAVWRQQGAHAENTFFVNVKTGECWHDAHVGTLQWQGGRGSSQVNLLTGGAGVVPRWQIAETTGEKKIWISYEVPGAPTANAA